MTLEEGYFTYLPSASPCTQC